MLSIAYLTILLASTRSAVVYGFSDACTSIAVGRKATVDGSTFATHTADCAECDWRINKVTAADWPAGSQRPIYALTGTYPKQVREDRGFTWSVKNLEQGSVHTPRWEKMKGDIIGYIPQVPHTHALIEGLYGIMNGANIIYKNQINYYHYSHYLFHMYIEHQVAIGESTCAAKQWAAPLGVSEHGKALLEASELSQIALERAKTAREAIQIMVIYCHPSPYPLAYVAYTCVYMRYRAI